MTIVLPKMDSSMLIQKPSMQIQMSMFSKAEFSLTDQEKHGRKDAPQMNMEDFIGQATYVSAKVFSSNLKG